LAVVLSCVSQPFVGSPSQSLQPESHVATAHRRAGMALGSQRGVPCAMLQPLPQLPQFWVVVTGVSQPLLGLLSQLP
jgi:hypothetical protein